MSCFLRLHVEGTHQSWAGGGVGLVKDTAAFPSRSGVVGLVAAALGLSRTDTRVDALHRACRVSSRVLRKGTVRVEYQNIRDWHVSVVTAPKKNPGVRGLAEVGDIGNPRQVWRSYIVDAAFQVVLEVGDRSPFSADEVLQALRTPAFPLYLGRRSCRLSYPLVGPTDAVIEAESPADVFGPISAHVLAMRDGDALRYEDGETRTAFLDLPAGVPPPSVGRIVPVDVDDAVLSNTARAFTTRIGHLWHMDKTP